MPRDKASQLTAVARVKELTEVKYEEYCKRGWHTKKGDTTKETNIKIKARDIMCAALKFDSIVKAGLMFDPSVFDSVAVLGKILPKYAIIEHHYRDRQTQEHQAFEDQIRDVYICILKYTACVQQELFLSPAGRLSKTFWTLDNQDITVLKDELKASDETVRQQANLVAHEYRKQEFRDLKTQALKTLDKIDFLVQEALEAEKRRTLEWLSDGPLADKQQQLRSQIERLNKNSGKWLLASREYTSWFKSPHSFLWLHGTSGCGKSMLFSTVVKCLVESSSVKDSNMVVSYWYFDNSNRDTQSIQRLLRLILRQIAWRATPLPESVLSLAKDHKDRGFEPSTNTLTKALADTVAGLDEDVFLVLDAIDEYQTGDNTLRGELLDSLVELGNSKLPNLHILVTSVSETDIENAFENLKPPPAAMDVEKPVSVDVDVYLDETIDRYAKEQMWSSEMKTKIDRTLKMDGRFRIVSLQLERLRNCFDDKQRNDVLNSIPHSIEDAYLKKLEDVPEKDVDRLRYIFFWISVAARQLTAVELAAAPGVGLHNTEHLFKICPSNMIRLEKQKPSVDDQTKSTEQTVHDLSDSETDVVTFDHPSVKRFLYSPKLQKSGDHGVSAFFVSEDAVNSELVNLMVDHLLAIEQPTIWPPLITEMPFLQYAARYWHEHLRDRKSALAEDEVLRSKLLVLFRDPMNPAYLNWTRIWDPERQCSRFGLHQDYCPSPLYMAVFLGLESISETLIDNGSYINGTGGVMHTTLQLASQRQEVETSQKLLDAGENTDKLLYDQATALYMAVDNGNAKIVRILLAAGAKPDSNYSLSGSALQLASLRGLTDIVQVLVETGADVNLQSGSFGTALGAAAAAGHAQIVAHLLNNGAKPDADGGLLGTAIQAAETGGHSDVVKLLVAEGAAWNEEGDSVWHEAYERWIFSSSMSQIPDCLLVTETLLATETQQMLAGALRTLNSSRLDWSNTFQTDKKSAAQKRAAVLTKSVQLVRMQGQIETESRFYVYRAFFCAFMLHCKRRAQALHTDAGKPAGGKSRRAADFDENWDRFSLTMVKLASSQKVIENGPPDDLIVARLELVKCYTLALEAVSEALCTVERQHGSRFIRSLNDRPSGWERLADFQQQSERVESIMRLARLERPFDGDRASKVQHELLKTTQQEIRNSFRTHEEGMQKGLAVLEHRIVDSVRDMLPGIIREEMRKLLAEQRENTNT
ncbi:hypothetical protein SLS63_005217 [Diaporthe eres]|uniref:NACHT domain-containing protein n=1 Tax=Diaporthe eres TaxID=83184 RepID=A0ABR1PC26_DIAER